ncbi:hypothetical protein MNBD_GAMMA11-1113 [hydrothermal vent metagenome]|uniref:Uncharacterized protein n=1 Tax=hydrothermal vent metagenome TaxID=652676 RepID=A0A3B0X8Z3_9ZZZZ
MKVYKIKKQVMKHGMVLRVEAPPGDEAFTLHTSPRKDNIANKIIAIHDEQKARECRFAEGICADHDIAHRPAAILPVCTD